MADEDKSCQVLKEGYDRYLTAFKKEMNNLGNITTQFNVEYLFHSIFGISKLGTEYYSKCPVKDGENEYSKINRMTDQAIMLLEKKMRYDTLAPFINKLKGVIGLIGSLDSELKVIEKTYNESKEQLKTKVNGLKNI